ncbi:hypothetical protein [Vitreimonas sp.]|jgi:hypothetical protein|uniref:hypothetical protein n=1 Tax=Vitreimonas sp. TaxID=3069702 RepID=UPI002ED81B93
MSHAHNQIRLFGWLIARPKLHRAWFSRRVVRVSLRMGVSDGAAPECFRIEITKPSCIDIARDLVRGDEIEILAILRPGLWTGRLEIIVEEPHGAIFLFERAQELAEWRAYGGGSCTD